MAPQICLVCSSGKREEIDRMIVNNGNLSKIARDFSISYDSVYRHSKECIGALLASASTRSLKIHTENLFNEMLELARVTKEVLQSALEDGHRGLSLKAVAQSRNNIDILMKFVLSMEEIQMKQHTIEVDQFNEERSAQLMREGLAALSPEEKAEYRRLNIKMLAAWGGHQTSEEDPVSVDEYRVDPEDHSLKPFRTTPRKQVDPDPCTEETDPPMRRTTPRQ